MDDDCVVNNKRHTCLARASQSQKAPPWTLMAKCSTLTGTSKPFYRACESYCAFASVFVGFRAENRRTPPAVEIRGVARSSLLFRGGGSVSLVEARPTVASSCAQSPRSRDNRCGGTHSCASTRHRHVAAARWSSRPGSQAASSSPC